MLIITILYAPINLGEKCSCSIKQIKNVLNLLMKAVFFFLVNPLR